VLIHNDHNGSVKSAYNNRTRSFPEFIFKLDSVIELLYADSTLLVNREQLFSHKK